MRQLLLATGFILVGFSPIHGAETAWTTIEEVAKSPAKFQDKFMVFDKVKLLGDLEKGKGKASRYFLPVRSVDGKLVTAAPRQKANGFSFIASKDFGETIMKNVREGKDYSVKLVCKMEESRDKKKWFAKVSQVGFYENGRIQKVLKVVPLEKNEPGIIVDVGGKWVGKFKSAGKEADESFELKEEDKGKIVGTWHGDSKILNGKRVNADLLRWTVERLGATYDVECRIDDGGASLSVTYTISFKDDGEVKTIRGESKVFRAGSR